MALSQSPQAYLISRDTQNLTVSCDLPGTPSISVDLVSFARALSSSRRWRELNRAVIVVRSEPVPMLGILGYFDEAEVFSVEGIAWQLRYWSRHLFYADYRKVEEDCQRLAALLKDRVDEKVLSEASFAAIPRGGLVVLGILSYFLDLRPEQLQGEIEGRWLIVVDDCAISGARFQEFLSRSSAGDVIFAHLYSHPELRAGIRRTERRVHECLAVGDLNDHAAEFFGDGYRDWQKRWDKRGGDYWKGLTERLCFPWTETDVAVWNSVSQEVEPGWRLMPYERCFKNRPDMSRVHIQEDREGPVRVAPGVLYAELEDEVLVADMTGGRMFVLKGPNGDAWKALLNGRGSPVGRESGGSGWKAKQPECDLDIYCGEFVEAGLLERRDES